VQTLDYDKSSPAIGLSSGAQEQKHSVADALTAVFDLFLDNPFTMQSGCSCFA